MPSRRDALPYVDAKDDEQQKEAVIERAAVSAKNGLLVFRFRLFRQPQNDRLLGVAWLISCGMWC